MTIYQLKEAFQNLLRPIVKQLFKQKITANQVTIAASLSSIAVGLVIWFFHDVNQVFLIIPFFMIFRMGLNAIDGMLAKEHDMKSDLGLILNEMGDVISDTALYIPFIKIEVFNPALIIMITILAIFTEMIGVIATQIGASRRYDGPMGKSDRAFFFGLVALLYGLEANITEFGNWALIAVTILLIVTVFNRAYQALKEVSIAK